MDWVHFFTSFDGRSYHSRATDSSLAAWTWLAAAPADRDGFVAYVARHAKAAAQDDPTSTLPDYLPKLFGAVDDYRAWLEAADKPDAATMRH